MGKTDATAMIDCADFTKVGRGERVKRAWTIIHLHYILSFEGKSPLSLLFETFLITLMPLINLKLNIPLSQNNNDGR